MPSFHPQTHIIVVPNYSPSTCCLLGGGGEQERHAQAGVTLKIATGHHYCLQTFVQRDGSVSKESEMCALQLAALEVPQGLTKTRAGKEG